MVTGMHQGKLSRQAKLTQGQQQRVQFSHYAPLEKSASQWAHRQDPPAAWGRGTEEFRMPTKGSPQTLTYNSLDFNFALCQIP